MGVKIYSRALAVKLRQVRQLLVFDSFFWTRLEKCLEEGKDISSLRKSKVYFICIKFILYMLGENQKKLPEEEQTKEKKTFECFRF